MSQRAEVIGYIAEFGSITPMEAFADLGITKLATRISEIIQNGEAKIKKQLVKGKNRRGKAVHYMKYSFQEE